LFIVISITCRRYEQGPPGSYNYPPGQSRLDKFSAAPYGSGQGPMKPGVRPYFGDHSESYGTPYSGMCCFYFVLSVFLCSMFRLKWHSENQ